MKTWRLMFLTSALYCYFAGFLEATASLMDVDVNNHAAQLDGSEATSVGDDEHVLFRFRRFYSQFGQKFFRVRYQLQGFDQDWKQARGVCQLVTVFYNSDNVRIDQKSHEVLDKSEGWNDDLEHSTFTHRHERILVPANAKKIGFQIISAGLPSNVGVYLVKSLRVTRPSTNGEPDQLILDGRPLLPPATEAKPRMPEWLKDGTNPSMAKLISLQKGEPKEAAWALIDDDSGGYALWRSNVVDAPEVFPGEHLVTDWDELYNSTTANIASAVYDHLEPGHYVFRVEAEDVWGKPSGETSSIDLLIRPPLWREAWFLGICAVLGNLFLILGGRHLLLAKARRQFERNSLLEKERLRISQDLHDDLGARLTHISLLSSHAARAAANNEALESFHEISTMTREMVAVLSETVWAVNPKNDNLESLIGFLCRTIDSQCRAAQVKYRIDALRMADPRMVSSDARHQVLLAVKEALNNSLKHSGSEDILAIIGFKNSVLRIVITDHGKGFCPQSEPMGNGLINLKQRMATVNGTVSVESWEGEGTTVTFEIPIAP